MEKFIMSNNVIELISNIFLNLKSKVHENELTRVVNVPKRIITVNKDEEIAKSTFEILKESTVTHSIKINSSQSVTGLKIKAESYLLIPLKGNNIDAPIGFIEKISQNRLFKEALEIYSISKDLIPMKEDSELSIKLVDKIFGIYSDDSDTIFYDITEILSFYEEFEVWKLDSNIFNIESEADIYRSYLIWRISNDLDNTRSHIFNLDYNMDFLVQFVSLCSESYSRNIIYELNNALNSTNWKHCYLELYRCIEQLYTIYHIDYLKNDLKVESHEIANALDKIGFRSRELTDLLKLFKTITVSKSELLNLKNILLEKSEDTNRTVKVTIDTVEKVKNFLDNQDEYNPSHLLMLLDKEIKKESLVSDEVIINKVAEKIYAIRCSIAHLSYRHINYDFSKEEWNRILTTIIMIIKELYSKFSDRLFELKENL